MRYYENTKQPEEGVNEKVKTIWVVFFVALAAMAAEAPKQKEEPRSTVVTEAGSNYGEIAVTEKITHHWGASGVFYRALESSVGYAGGEYIGKIGSMTLAPGIGMMFGQHEPVGLALRFRAECGEHSVVACEGSVIQALRSSEPHEKRRDRYASGHISPQFQCWGEQTCQFGLTAESDKHMGEGEWGIGGRIALPLAKHHDIKFVAKGFHNGTWRVGLIFHH